MGDAGNLGGFWMRTSYSEENTHERSNLVWPVVFCYRQYIELALKDMIAVHGKQVVPEILPNWKDHQLPTLWRSYKELVKSKICCKFSPVTDVF